MLGPSLGARGWGFNLKHNKIGSALPNCLLENESKTIDQHLD